MASQEPVDTKQFLSSFKGFMDQAVAQAPKQEPAFVALLRNHFGVDPTNLPIVAEQLEKSEHPNLHLAVTRILEQDDWSFTLTGVVTQNDYMGIKLAHLLSNQRGGGQVNEGPVEYINIALHDNRVLACVQSGLYLIRHNEQSLALLVRGPREMSPRTGLDVEVMASDRTIAEEFLGLLRATMRKHNVYRSHIISLSSNNWGSIDIQFHHLPTIERENIILPTGILERIERETISFARLSDKLRAAKRHIKRGMLLYGPPGTGKTLTAMYIAHQMPERTTILLTGRGIGLLEQSCNLARMLQPATLIMEDVDLIAEERTNQNPGCNTLLFELLNQMDGLADDADILFLLTTNRPDILEPALAARPGRIDQATEIPLPDRECRQRLFALYGEGLTVHAERLPQIIDQTHGVSATFIRELIRKAALFAADEPHDEIIVEDRHIEDALKELVLEGGELTKRLLGASRAF